MLHPTWYFTRERKKASLSGESVILVLSWRMGPSIILCFQEHEDLPKIRQITSVDQFLMGAHSLEARRVFPWDFLVWLLDAKLTKNSVLPAVLFLVWGFPLQASKGGASYSLLSAPMLLAPAEFELHWHQKCESISRAWPPVAWEIKGHYISSNSPARVWKQQDERRGRKDLKTCQIFQNSQHQVSGIGFHWEPILHREIMYSIVLWGAPSKWWIVDY